NWMLPRAALVSQTTASISKNIRQHSILKSTMDPTGKGLRGAVPMVSVAGFAIAVARQEASRAGIRNGARRCDRRWIICVMRTQNILKLPEGHCSLILGRPVTKA